MTANQFFKHTPFKAGSPKSRDPMLRLTIEKVDEERKHLHVRTRGGVPLLLAYDGKACCFHLHKFRVTGGIGGRVYNNWQVEGEDIDTQNNTASRWG